MTIVYPAIIRTNGQVETYTPANGLYYALEELQTIVGGSIQIVSLDKGDKMILNEEGKLLGLPYNEIATELFNLGGRMWFDPIVGDVLVCDNEWMNDGERDEDEPDGDTYFDV